MTIMSELSKALDLAERAYAVEPTPTSWKAVLDARTALERETTRQDALARIEADGQRALDDARRTELRRELAALLPTLSHETFYASIESERERVSVARAALDAVAKDLPEKVEAYRERCERALTIQRALGIPRPSAGHSVNDVAALAMLLNGLPPIADATALIGNLADTDVLEALGLGRFAGVDVPIWTRSDTKALARAAIRDRLEGTDELARLVASAEQERAKAAQRAKVRFDAVAEGRRHGNDPDNLAALADAAEARIAEPTGAATESN
jgi:hypothetical protein